MRIFGFILIGLGVLLGIYALTMDVSIRVPGESTKFEIANIERLLQRLNFIVISGVLCVIGSLFVGFHSLQAPPEMIVDVAGADIVADESSDRVSANGPVSVSICSYCKFMGSGTDESCTRCGKEFMNSAAPQHPYL